jgi:rubrerythrin
MLAKEEQKHLDYLAELSREYAEGKDLKIPDLPKPVTLQDSLSPIFSQEFKEKIADKHFEMATLSIGMKLEIDSEKLYRGMAQSTDQAKLKEFFNRLADWESGHYMYLSKQISFWRATTPPRTASRVSERRPDGAPRRCPHGEA